MTDGRDIVDRDEDAGLDALFAAVRAGTPAPSDAFLARLVTTAEAMQPAAMRQPVPVSRRRSWFSGLGGWPALGGLVAAAATGFWVGIAPPEGLTTLAAEMSGQVADVGIYGEDEFLALLEG